MKETEMIIFIISGQERHDAKVQSMEANLSISYS